MVAPVVKTSSTNINTDPATSLRAAKAPATFASRATGVNAVWVAVSRVRTRRSTTGQPQRRPRARASCSLWLYPLARSRAGLSGTGRSRAAPASGRLTLAIATAMSSAMRGSPPYLRRCTARRVGGSSHTAERTHRSSVGHSLQMRQVPNTGSGCPHRSHQGGTSGLQRDRQTGQTRLAERSNARSA